MTSWAATGSTIMRGAAQKWPVYNLGKGTVSEAVPDSLANMAFAPGGRALSYLWWITFFQFVGILLAGAALSKKELRIGAVGLFAVLTTSTFIYTADVRLREQSPLALHTPFRWYFQPSVASPAPSN